MNRKKIILDTDIGDDIDDAFALFSAVKSEKTELLGVTTVYYNVADRAREAKKLLVAAGRGDIPVYAGYGNPLWEQVNTTLHNCQYTQDLSDSAYDYENPGEGVYGESAVDFILDTVRKYGKDVTVIAIGPMTNIARAFNKAPEVMKGAKVVAMAGNFYTQFREWNIVCDADAAKTVVNNIEDITLVGLEVTSKTELSEEAYKTFMDFRGDAATDYLQQLVLGWKRINPKLPVLHDVLTLYYVTNPALIETEKRLIYVETEGKYGRGYTFNIDEMYSYRDQPTEGKRISIAKELDRELFFKEFFDDLYRKE